MFSLIKNRYPMDLGSTPFYLDSLEVPPLLFVLPCSLYALARCAPARTVAHQLDKARGYDYRRHAVIDPCVHTCGRPTT